jgi:predicted regulator of Ras-like GTPase activity (Roadblock/LC7/MglB family)
MDLPRGARLKHGILADLSRFCEELPRGFAGSAVFFIKSGKRFYEASLLLSESKIIAASLKDVEGGTELAKEEAIEEIGRKVAASSGDLDFFSFSDFDMKISVERNLYALVDSPVELPAFLESILLEAKKKADEVEQLRRSEEEAREKAELEKKRSDEERARRDEEKRRWEEEKRRLEQERLRKSEDARRRQEEEDRKRRMEEERAKKEEDERKRGEEEERQRKLEEERKRKAVEEAHRQAEEQARRMEEERRRKEEEERKRKADEEARLKAEEEKKRKAEEEKKRKADADAEARRKAEEEKKRAAEAERIRKDEEHKVEEEKRIKAEIDEEVRIKTEEEKKRAAEEDSKRKAEDEKKRKAAEEEEARRKAEQDSKLKGEEEKKRKGDEVLKRKTEEEARSKAEEEERSRKEEELKKQAKRAADAVKVSEKLGSDGVSGPEAEARNRGRAKIAGWKDKGYVTEPLERALESDAGAFGNALKKFEFDATVLQRIEKQLDSLDTAGFEDRSKVLRFKLRDTQRIVDLMNEVTQLEKDINVRKSAKASSQPSAPVEPKVAAAEKKAEKKEEVAPPLPVKGVSKKDSFANLLRNLEISAKDIKGVAVTTKNGLPIAVRLPRELDIEAFCGMSAAMYGAAETTMMELRRSALLWVYTETDDSTLVVVDAGSSTLLVALISAGANIGLVLVKLKYAADTVRTLMK